MMRTERLTLRGWREADIPAYLAMSRDPRVMTYYPSLALPNEARGTMQRQQAMEKAGGHCFWIVERIRDRAFLGFCGVKQGPGGTPIAGLAEIGWRLARNHWGQGYAQEAAHASLDWVWRNTDQPSAWAMTVPANARSRALMERLGMERVPDGDFDHPDIARGHPLSRHILYRIDRPA